MYFLWLQFPISMVRFLFMALPIGNVVCVGGDTPMIESVPALCKAFHCPTEGLRRRVARIPLTLRPAPLRDFPYFLVEFFADFLRSGISVRMYGIDPYRIDGAVHANAARQFLNHRDQPHGRAPFPV